MPSSLKIPYPPGFTNALNSLKLLNFDFVKFTPVECVKRINFVESLYVTTTMPIFGFLVIFLCYLIHVSIINNCCCMLKFCEERKKNYWETVVVHNYHPVKNNKGDDYIRDKNNKVLLEKSDKTTEGVAQDERFRRSFVINPLWPSYAYGLLYISGIILPGITCKIFQMFVCYDIGSLMFSWNALTLLHLITYFILFNSSLFTCSSFQPLRASFTTCFSYLL